jgi:parvulin-like peptidyl-prolyl isomerase
MNRKFFVLILALSCIARAEDIVDRIVAKVDNSIVTASDIEEAVAASALEIRSKYPPDQWDKKINDLRQQVLKQLIDEHVLAKAARDASITLSDEEVNAYIQSLWTKAGIQNEEQFKAELKNEGLTLDELKDNLRRQILAKKVLQREIYSKIKVSDIDLKQYYDENKSLYHEASKVKIALLLLPVAGADAEDWNKTKTVADGIHQKLVEGAEFTDMVKQYSKGPAVAEGGDIGFIEKGKGIPEFEDVAFSLTTGQFSEPFRTQHGWNLIKIEDAEQEKYRPFAEVRPEIESLVQQLKARDQERDYIEKQRNKTYIELMEADPGK